MTKQLSVLYVSTEGYPFIKVSGLGDVAYSFPLAMRDLGHDMRLMLPKYGSVSERRNRIHEINRLRNMQVQMGDATEIATVKSSSINNPRAKVQAYITTNQTYFDSRKGVYYDPKTYEEYRDNHERFIFFSKTVVDTCLLLGWFPDIIHCNDWRTGLIPGYVKALYPNKFKKTKVILTVHNFSQQGDIPGLDIKITDLPKTAIANYKHKNLFNFLKGALIYSDFVTTVSPSYAKDVLKDKEHTNGLNIILKEKGNKFVGIKNGIDNWQWNPACDDKISANLLGDMAAFKQKNKQALDNHLKFKLKPDVPLIGMINKIDEQKGIPFFIEAADKLLKENIQIVMLGEGDSEFKKKLEKIEKKFSAKFKFISAIDDILAHKIEAASDMFLMPSKYEPCGLNLMYSLRYGAVPIVHYTGGIKDTAIAHDGKTKKGNSFVFKKYNVEDMLTTVKKALAAFKDKKVWDLIMKNGVEGDYSWSQSAQQYSDIYKEL